MAITIKKTRREVTLSLWEKSYLPEVLRGMYITLRHFARNFGGLINEFVLGGGRGERKIMTVYYPEETLIPPPAFRGRPVLVRGSNGLEKCVACGLCEAVCPPHCISIIGGERDNGDRYPVSYTLDGARCIFCGRCEEVCPKEAIVMSDSWRELCEYDRSRMLYTKEDLLVPESDLKKRLDLIRSRYYSAAQYETIGR
ncbi:MAG: NADH-quinone oxidoreductase subunit I [Nitrospinae bacterium]|nr:NADH-quinone oxidoreductase subunit I [Nitrospinota bacterium]